MTTLTAHYATTRTATRATTFERTLLRAASALDAFVLTRVERRGADELRRVARTQDASAEARRSAQARGAMGVLPR